MEYEEILSKLKSMGDPKAAEGMAKFGINTKKAYGVSIPNVRALAKKIGKDHNLAQSLWSSGIHEARILAGIVDDPKMVTEEQMEKWVKDFDSWDVCDQCCSNLFDKTNFAHGKAIEWSKRREEFVRRAGFTLMATLAVHDKKARDEDFIAFLPLIKDATTDERNFVKKAVNWALRQIGKRDARLNKMAVELAKEIQKIDSRSAKWIASDAIGELTGKAIQQRLKVKSR
ncbi:MAG: DNA alkylation repair protein [Thaumarchaeota archaeon]|nr:DNA alkylation repair protein [Nitrososphaerota archaeon]